MVIGSNTTFNHLQLNGWRLLGWISLGNTLLVAALFMANSANNPAHISDMIANSVRVSVPWLYVAFAASSLLILFPNNLTKWIMKNRRYIGLCFAAGMMWQLFFIVWLVFGYNDYYMEEKYSFHALVEEIPGYLILFALIITSFVAGRNILTGKQWRILHKIGIYFLWAVVFSAYWYELYYYNDIQIIDYIYYWMGIGAWLVRIVAWAKKRGSHKQYKMASGKQSPLPLVNIIAALSFTVIGLAMIFSGEIWASVVMRFTSQLFMHEWLEHLMALIPVLPFYVAALAASTRQRVNGYLLNT